MILQMEGLGKSFNGFRAVAGVNLKIEEKVRYALIGPNGAGKSTLFNLICGVLPPDEGKVFFKGKDITGLPPYDIARMGVGRSLQILSIFPRLSGFENIQMSLISKKREGWNLLSRSERMFREECFEILESVGFVADKAGQISNTLSYGEQRLLDLGIALALKPELLLLDEPSAGLTVAEVESIVSLIKNLAAERDMTVICCEHDMDMVYSMAERIVVMYQGRILAEGKLDEIRNNQEVMRVYLGR